MIVKAALLAGLSFGNTPYSKDFTLWPSLELRESWGPRPIGFFTGIQISARCIPGGWKRWNPVTALWTVEMGFNPSHFEIAVGHQSQHGVSHVDALTESFDYVRVEYVFP